MTLDKQVVRKLAMPRRLTDEKIRVIVGSIPNKEDLAEAYYIVTGREATFKNLAAGRRRLGRQLKKAREEAHHKVFSPSRYRSTYIKDQLKAGRTDYDTLVAECQKRFPDLKTDLKAVLYYRWCLRREGHDV